MMTNRRGFLGMSAGALVALGAIPARAYSDDARQKTILMLGGTGFLGPHTVEAALRRGHKITLFNRGKTRPDLFPDLEKLHGDREKDDLKALEGRKWDAVVDTSANVPRWVTKAASVIGRNVGHYIYISSVSVYADTSKPGIDETSAVAKIEDPTAHSDATFTWADVDFLEKQGVHAWSDMPAWVPSSDETAGFAKVSDARAIKAGLTFRPIADTAKVTLDWIRSQPENRRSKLRAGLSRERETKVLAAWKARAARRES
jgi:hypothetical protein